MEFFEQDTVVVISGPSGNPEEACQVFFYGEYHYCGDAGFGYVFCCPEAAPGAA